MGPTDVAIKVVLQVYFTDVVLVSDDEAFLYEVVILAFDLLHGPALHVLLVLREVSFLACLLVEHAKRALLVAEPRLLEVRLRAGVFVVA